MTLQGATLLLAIAIVADTCAEASPSGPPGLPTLRVVNSTCAGASCRTVEIREFDWSLPIPQPPWGYKIIGEVHNAAACLTFPQPWTFAIIGPKDTTPGSPIDTFTYHLSTKDTITLVAMDSALFRANPPPPTPYDAYLGVSANQFSAATAAGWTFRLSGGTDSTTAAPAPECTP